MHERSFYAWMKSVFCPLDVTDQAVADEQQPREKRGP
jgi:hypothetical protein